MRRQILSLPPGCMRNLGLAHPKLMDVAVPADLLCGRPEAPGAPPDEPGWAPLTYALDGVRAIQPQALEERASGGQNVDVREPREFTDARGHIRGARAIPLSGLSARAGELDPARPVVTVCRSVARSAQAAAPLQKSGFGEVANLAGGMRRWRAEALPVADGND